MKHLIALALFLLLVDLALSQNYDDGGILNDQARKTHFERLNKAICYSKPDYGKCRGSRQLWYFNKYRSKCEKFTYSNCGGNPNRFYTKDECDVFCTEKAREWLKKEMASVV